MGVSVVRFWVALSGLLLVVFVLVHLAGVLLAAWAPASFEMYAASLHRAVVLPFVELGLLVAALSHVGFSLTKAMSNRLAGNHAILVSRRHDPLAAFAAASQAIGGVLLLLFLGLHLSQLRWPRPGAGEELVALRAVLAQPVSLAIYLAASLVVGLHLFHGGEAAHRSLGILDPMNAGRIRKAARGMAWLVAGGFILATLWLAYSL
jgi:succinate dehydrogenase / fumarate reductase cytochrome b subunit